MNRRRAVVLSALFSPVVLAWSSSHAGVTITGVVDFTGATTVQLRGISQDGRVAGYRTINGVTEGFIRSGGVDSFFQNDGANTFALGINDAGAAVGGSNPVGGVSSAFIRSPDGAFTTFNPAGTSRSAVGINNAGVTVGGLDTANGAWIRATDGTETSFTYAGQSGETVLNTNATDILNDGTIIGHSVLLGAGGLAGRGWLTIDGGLTFSDIAAPGFAITFAWGGNDTGLVVGDVSNSQSLALRSGFVLDRTSGSYTFFDVAGADWTVPTGINDAGQIVGFWRSADDGRIRGFTALVPSPGTVSLLAGVALIACRRRR